MNAKNAARIDGSNLEESVLIHNLKDIHSLMDRGDYFKAKLQLIEQISCLNENDPFLVEFVIDLGGCMYMTNDMDQVYQQATKAYRLFNELYKNLNSFQRLSCRLKLGRLFEELGHISVSFELYQVTDSPTNTLENRRLAEIFSERLRLACSYGEESEISRCYKNLESMARLEGVQHDVIQHALIRADMINIGFTAALERLETIKIQSLNLNNEHQQWLKFDFVFSALENNRASEINEEVLSEFDYLQVGLFEQVIWDILRIAQNKSPFFELTAKRTEGLSLLSSLRVLNLMLQFETDPVKCAMIKSKFSLLIKAIDRRSRFLLRQRFKDQTEHNPDSSAEIAQNITAKLTKLEIEFVKCFQSQKVISVEDISKLLYDLEPSVYVINRLRVMAYKINQKLADVSQSKFRLINHKIELDGSLPAIFIFK